MLSNGVLVLGGPPCSGKSTVARILSADAVERHRRRHQATDLDEELVRERRETFSYSDQALRLAVPDADPDDLAQRITAWLGYQPRSIHRDSWVDAGKGWDWQAYRWACALAYRQSAAAAARLRLSARP